MEIEGTGGELATGRAAGTQSPTDCLSAHMVREELRQNFFNSVESILP
jgi:hypothetical protein